jgi:hypothetical protein
MDEHVLDRNTSGTARETEADGERDTEGDAKGIGVAERDGDGEGEKEMVGEFDDGQVNVTEYVPVAVDEAGSNEK